jgi:hypothetical protein
MNTKTCFFTDANRAEISMAALAAGTSLPTQARCFLAIAQRRIALHLRGVDLVRRGR